MLNNDLRHPAVLAQDLASLDVLSEGRLDVAIGAGWNRPEYEAIGIPFDRTPVRQARLAEAIAVLKGCFADGPFSFAGEHYTITELRRPPQADPAAASTLPDRWRRSPNADAGRPRGADRGSGPAHPAERRR